MSQKSTPTGKKTDDPYVNYLRELKEIDTEDPSLHEKVNSAMRRHGITPSDRRFDSYESPKEEYSRYITKRREQPIVEEDDMLGFFNRPFERLHQRMNGIWKMMEKQFEEPFEENTFDDLEKTMPEGEPTTYCKYVQNMTSYENGVRKSKSVSGVEKHINGKRYTSKKMTTDDGNNVMTKQVYPDGREIEQKMPSKARKKLEFKKSDFDDKL